MSVGMELLLLDLLITLKLITLVLLLDLFQRSPFPGSCFCHIWFERGALTMSHKFQHAVYYFEHLHVTLCQIGFKGLTIISQYSKDLPLYTQTTPFHLLALPLLLPAPLATFPASWIFTGSASLSSGWDLAATLHCCPHNMRYKMWADFPRLSFQPSLSHEDARVWRRQDALPFFFTMTCKFPKKRLNVKICISHVL